MTKYSKYNIVYRLQKWMDTVAGQTFLNYTYSWGAAIVILAALFELTHMPGANIMLFIGMGVEVFVFFISGFDRPFDKTAEGRELPSHLTEEFLASGLDDNASQPTQEETTSSVDVGVSDELEVPDLSPSFTPHIVVDSEAKDGTTNFESDEVLPLSPTSQSSNYIPQMSSADAEKLNAAQADYVEELKNLVDTLKKVNDQSTRLTRDSEEMENLNRTLTGISKVYEMQLKGVSQQIGTIDQINEQTQRMAKQIEQLNQIYARMIEAMTINMPMAAANPSSQPLNNKQ